MMKTERYRACPEASQKDAKEIDQNGSPDVGNPFKKRRERIMQKNILL